GFECLANVFRYVESFLEPKWPALDSILECFAFNEFEYEKPGVTGFFEIVNGSDVWVVQRREYFRFTLEPAHPILVPAELVRKNLDRDLTLELRIASAI